MGPSRKHSGEWYLLQSSFYLQNRYQTFTDDREFYQEARKNAAKSGEYLIVSFFIIQKS